MKTPHKRCQSGFTLVEIAIVLVIIGLLLGGVLKGTELIENSKVKRAITEVNGTSWCGARAAAELSSTSG